MSIHQGSHQPTPLTPIEARLIGCLMEKQRTTPDQYPLTLNALVSACNQKTARQPVMTLSPGEVAHAAGQLRDRGLIHVSSSGRTERYDHKLVGTYFISREEQALLSVLVLRGPQTLGELRTNAVRLADFPTLEAVAKALRGLAERSPALVTELPRVAGRREERYAHLLCGTPIEETTNPGQPTSSAAGDAQDERLAALETVVAALRTELDRLWSLTGLADHRDT